MIYKKLSELSINNKGYYGIGASSCNFSVNLPQYLRITDISDDGRIPSKLPTCIDVNSYPEYKKYYLQDGDLLLARTGNSTGRNILFKGKSNSTIFAGFLIKFSINKELVNPYYVGYYCQSKQYYDQIEGMITGSTRPNINAEQYGDLLIPIYDSTTQHHIVDSIGSVDDAIEKNEGTIEKLEAFADKIYDIHENIESSGTIKLGNCTNIVTGKLNANASSENGQYKFFTCSHEDSKIDTYSFDCEAIILSGNGEIEAKYYKGKFDAYQRTYVLCPNNYFFLFLIELKRQISNLKSSSQGSVIKFITKGMIENITININNQSNQLNDVISKIYRYAHYLKNKNGKYKQIKQKLLNKYFD